MSKEKWSGINPLNQKTIKLLDNLSLDDLERKIAEIIKFCNETKDQCFFGKEMNVCNGKQPIGSTCDDTVCNGKGHKDYNNCPFCQAEKDGYSSGWGFSDEGWNKLKHKHDEGHKTSTVTYGLCDCPDDCQLHPS